MIWYIFGIGFVGWVLYDWYEEHERKAMLKHLRDNPPPPKPEPIIGMTEREVDRDTNWMSYYTTTTTETVDGICIVRYYEFKGKLTFENGILTKIVRFNN